MKEKIKKILILINSWKVILVILLVGIGLLFYWNYIRPKQIEAFCRNKALNVLLTLEEINPKEDEILVEFLFPNSNISRIYESTYNNCLKEKAKRSFIDEILK